MAELGTARALNAAFRKPRVPTEDFVRAVSIALTASRLSHIWMLKVILNGLVSALESLALRHQLEVLQRNSRRPRLGPSDRALWAVLSRVLPGWRRHRTIVQPATVVRWHRAGWRLYWRWRSSPGRGRPKASAEVRALIRRMSLENPPWGAPSQTWRTFIRNHMTEIVAIDFLTVPTVAFRSLYCSWSSRWTACVWSTSTSRPVRPQRGRACS